MCYRRAPIGFRLTWRHLISMVTAIAVDLQNTTRMYVTTNTDIYVEPFDWIISF